MSTGVFVLLLILGLVFFLKSGRPFLAVVCALIVGVMLVGGTMSGPVRAIADSLRSGLAAMANSLFAGGG